MRNLFLSMVILGDKSKQNYYFKTMMYEVVIYARLLIVCLYDLSWGNPGPIFLRFLSENLLKYL